ncbi:MAG: anti-oxidant AhpCTSA family protein [Gemmatimonadota bacterium]
MPHVSVGSPAPDFSLAPAPGPGRVTLSEHRGHPVVLLFFPLAFSSTCTEELCHVAEDWSRWEEVGARVLGLSIDSPYVNQRFAGELRLPFPLLSDFNKDASSAYGVLYPEFYGMKGVSKRAAFVVDGEGTVAYAWVAEEAGLLPPFEEILEAVRRVA